MMNAKALFRSWKGTSDIVEQAMVFLVSPQYIVEGI